MSKIRIEGGKLLTGTINISGAKNSGVGLIPAAILCDEETTILNVPNISDVDSLEEILRCLKAKINRESNSVKIDSSKIENTIIPEELRK